MLVVVAHEIPEQAYTCPKQPLPARVTTAQGDVCDQGATERLGSGGDGAQQELAGVCDESVLPGVELVRGVHRVVEEQNHAVVGARAAPQRGQQQEQVPALGAMEGRVPAWERPTSAQGVQVRRQELREPINHNQGVRAAALLGAGAVRA